MSFERGKWTTPFHAAYGPIWECPSCHKGKLRILKNSLVEHETVESKDQRQSEPENWHEMMYELTFSLWLVCDNKPCGQNVVVAGTGGVDITGVDSDGVDEFDRYYMPNFVHPAPYLVRLPGKCPKNVHDELRTCFSLYWHDVDASANRLRVAVELLLDYLGVKRQRRTKKKELHKLTLHERLKEYAETNPTIGAYLMSIKWLGNTASHEAQISRDRLLDALEIFDHVLAEVIDKRSKRIEQLAKDLDKQFAPRRKRTRSTGTTEGGPSSSS